MTPVELIHVKMTRKIIHAGTNLFQNILYAVGNHLQEFPPHHKGWLTVADRIKQSVYSVIDEDIYYYKYQNKYLKDQDKIRRNKVRIKTLNELKSRLESGNHR